MEDGLINIDYNVSHHAMLFRYEPDAPYEIRDIIAYVEDASDGRTDWILVFENTTLMHNLRRSDSAGWYAVAIDQKPLL